MTPDDIRDARITLGFSQRNLAAALGVHRITVINWERGKHRMPLAAATLLQTWLQEATHA